MSFFEALTNYKKPINEVADLTPSHLIVADAYVAYVECLPRDTITMFFDRMISILQSPNCRTRLIDLGFMDLRADDTALLERILNLPSIRFVDLRRGNFRLHVEATLRMIHEVISRSSSAISRVYIYPTDLPEYLRNSPKLMCVDDEELFEALVQREPQKPAVVPSQKATGSPLRRNPAKPSSAPSGGRVQPKSMNDALEIFRQHGLTPAQMFESPGSIDALLGELLTTNKDQWHSIVDASRIIHQVLPISVVRWARKCLAEVGLEYSIFNKEKIDTFYQSIDDKKRRSMIERCIGVMRRHVGMVLHQIGYSEAEAQTKMDSLRKKAESYKSSRRYDDAAELEEAMSLVIDWRPEFGFACKETEEPQKVDYQIIRRNR
ncbi:BRCA1-associated RING domain protein 1-like protein [Perkinsela sp. CCAP 1560/4]|nr:BRCA1-associated RING domain protein 1-like protein [Perkinsela sp. CCAP 1560/4]|eukprot:KNH09705.1 BRCA1-associated RING domain protein 1-like protein [Perkinsela sp. CCAP 1560/4]